MRTKAREMFGIDVPIFAFSHCRDVVVEVTRAGGLGVLGAARHSKESLEHDLNWIDRHVGGRPYGVDLLLPEGRVEGVFGERKFDLDNLLPGEHVAFVNTILDAAGIPPLPADMRQQLIRAKLESFSIAPEDSEELFEIALRHPIKLVASALGTPPKHLVDRAHSMGIKVGALAGKVQHAIDHRDAGLDFIVAQGTEAGGHTGKVSSMILWPQLVDAVAPMPVLAAGGVGSGRQMAAALAMGAEGVWCGSIWLGTKESEWEPEDRALLYAAHAEDAIQSRVHSGKPVRMLRNKFNDAWNQPGAPAPLKAPLQTMLVSEAYARFDRYHASEYKTIPVGQVVEQMKQETSVRRIIETMMAEFAEATQRLIDIVD